MRKFNPRNFFLSVLRLSSTTNNEGYPESLRKAWSDIGLSTAEPVKSSFSKMRQKISYKFFEDYFLTLLQVIKPYRKKFKGLYVYAIDGQESVIPLSEDILREGYRGRPNAGCNETYYPRIYMSQAFDVLNEITVGISFGPKQGETKRALEFLDKTEKNSLFIYDRLYLSKNLLLKHLEVGNYFIFRCQRGATFKAVMDFAKSLKRESMWDYEGLKIRLVKVKNPKTKIDLILATNLDKENFSLKDLSELYSRRWSIETSFRDSVQQGLEQWHSKSLNGVLQELYTHLWALNWSRLQLLAEMPPDEKTWLDKEYKKSNLKILFKLMMESIPEIMKNLIKEVYLKIKDLIRRTVQRRKRQSRSFERVRKYSRKSFPFKNLVPQKSRLYF